MAKKKVDLKTYLAYIIICVSIIFVVGFMNRIGLFDKLELPTYDMRFRWRGVVEHAKDIEIVAIDPQTLDLLGLIGMPSRDYHVALLDNLFAAGAKAVLFDVLFLVYTGPRDPLDPIKGTMSVADSLFADALFFYDKTVLARKQIVSMDMSTGATAGEPPLPIAEFRYPDRLGFVSMYHDSDGFVRRAELVNDDFGMDQGWQYSYALKAAMVALDADTAWVDYEKHMAYVGDRVIPLDTGNKMVINFCMDEKTYAENLNYISYDQVIDNSEFGIEALVKAGRIKDKVILVGATFPESKDTENTPFHLGTKLYSSTEYPMYGVHVHHNIASTIINNKFLIPLKEWHTWILIAVMAIATVAISLRFKGYLGLVFSVAIMFLYIVAAVYLFLNNRLIVPLVVPSVVTVIVSYVGVGTYNFIKERKQKAMIKNTFSRYVPGKVVAELLKNPEMLTLGGEERVMSVIFSDVAGFTTISESLTPIELVQLLNEYLSAMTDIVLENDGIIDKYEGDAIMAEFGAPLQDDDHALKACITALEMQKKLTEMRKKWKAEGKPEMEARVGINSGSMVIGNMGSTAIFDYTVMGDNVNLSSRLEGANKEYKTFIMCSEATRLFVEHELITRELDLLRVKGKTEGVLVHEIMARKSEGLSETKQKVLELYHKGLTAYKERRWQDGIDLFSEAYSLDETDGPSEIYMGRCKEFLEEPPSDDWDGIFTMRTK